MAKTRRVTSRQIEALTPFVRIFEIMGFQCGECPRSEPDSSHGSIIPGFGANDPVANFIQTLRDHDWIEPLDWRTWQHEAARYIASPELVAMADAETIRKLLSIHVRRDRDCHGHLAAQFESGHILALTAQAQSDHIRAVTTSPRCSGVTAVVHRWRGRHYRSPRGKCGVWMQRRA